MDPDEMLARMEGQRDSQVSGVRAYEDGVVRAVLRAAGCEISRPRLEAHVRRTTADEYATVRWFSETFTEAPFSLYVSQYREFWKLPASELFGPAFLKTPIVREYDKVVGDADADPDEMRQPLLVFRASRTQTASLMVVHCSSEIFCSPAAHTSDELGAGVTRIYRVVGRPHRVYVIEGLQSYLDTVGRSWVHVADF